jgi:hypothetical protein
MDNFIPSFPFECHFSCLMAVARDFYAMLCRVVRVGILVESFHHDRCSFGHMLFIVPLR